jgi:hypothetical protein
MKRLLFILFSAVLLVGCESDKASEDPVKLELSESSINIGCIGGEVSIELTHNYEWVSAVSSEGEWLSLDIGNTSGEVTTIVVSALGNDTETGREGSITFYSKDVERTLTITQDAPSADVETSVISFDFSGGNEHVTFTTNIPEWSVEVTSGESEWCDVQKDGTDGIVIEAEPNYTDFRRSATVTITAGTLTREVTVLQDLLIFTTSHSSLDFDAEGGTQNISVTTNATEWTLGTDTQDEWLSVTKNSSEIVVSVSENQNKERGRTATLTLSVGTFSIDIPVLQLSAGKYADKQVVQLQSATKGSGVNIVIMGDGYIASDMTIGGGKYEKDMTAAMEHFFSVYPYDAYREYFNIWMVGAISNEAGLSSKQPRKNVDTVFGSIWDGGNSTGIDCNEDIVISYARLVENIVDSPHTEITVIMPINSYIYAGTCMLYNDGFSISMCPVGPTYREIVVHEANGHGFGKLADEYITSYSNISSDQMRLQQLKNWKRIGYGANVDLYSDILETTWAGFAGNPDYPMVGTFEGGHYYRYGVWRAEFNSCMNDNVLYFNAPSRFAQIQRIYEWGGLEYSFEQFLEDDIIPPYPSNQRAKGSGVLAPFIPLAPPITNF